MPSSSSSAVMETLCMPPGWCGNFRFVAILTVLVVQAVKWLMEEPPALPQERTSLRFSVESKMNYKTFVYDTNLFPYWDTNVSTPESVLEHGFPYYWKPCTLSNVFSSSSRPRDGNDQKKNKAMQLVVLGGSASAHSALECRTDQALFAGRYSNILRKRLRANALARINNTTNDPTAAWMSNVQVINRAQGATDSLWNALLLDELVVPNETDVLVWELGINDALGGTTKSLLRTPEALKQMMNLWLWRVASLFAAHNKPPPPLICVYLWDANFYIRSDVSNDTTAQPNIRINHQHDTIQQTAWEAQREVIEHYRGLGWNIGVINVAAAVNGTNMVHDPSLLLDDMHHPNCQGVQLIATMIQHFFYNDRAMCTSTNARKNVDSKAQEQTNNSRIALVPWNFTQTQRRENNYTTGNQELLNTLFQDHTRIKIGSITPWQPTLDISALSVTFHGNASEYLQPIHGTRSVPWRKDRKYGYVVPLCPSSELQWTIHEPGLEWLGLGYKIHGNHWLQLSVNGVSLSNSTNSSTVRPNLTMDTVGEFKQWVAISELGLPKRDGNNNNSAFDSYTLSTCYLPKTSQGENAAEEEFAPQLTWMVGAVALEGQDQAAG